GHHPGVLHRVHEQPLGPVDVAGDDRVPPVVVRELPYPAAQSGDRRQLRLRRVFRHGDGGGHAERARGPGDPLGHVPPPGGGEALGPAAGRREQRGVGRAADLERADRLEVLQLEVDLGGGILDAQPQQRGPDRRARDPLARRLDRGKLDHSSTSVPRPCARAAATAVSAAARSSTAMPSERNSVSSRSSRRPAAVPVRTSPSSARMCSSPPISPSLTASWNSPASASTDSRLSQNSALAATVAVSISFARGVLAPTALTWAPGLSQARWS